MIGQRVGRPSGRTAIALGIFFGTSAQFWLNLQTQFDIRRVQMEKEVQLRSRIRPVAVA